jgi:hypothetical protein
MDTLRSTVYIPLVELTDQPNQLLEVYCEKQSFGASELDTKALDKDWDFIVAQLRRIGLYEDGLLAVNSVRKLGLKIPVMAIYQRFKKYGWLDNQRLYYLNALDCEGKSVQLGLALALLLNASDSPIRYAIATGKLSGDTKKNQAHDYDVAVESVNGIPEKLQLLLEKRSAKVLPEGSLYCFTPYHYPRDNLFYPVLDLAEVKELEKLSIHVKPIHWLSEAAKILQADKSRYLPQDKGLAAGTGILSTFILTFSLYLGWWHYPIPLEILVGKNKPEPFLVCTNRDLSEVSYYDLQRNGGIPLFLLFPKENINYNTEIAWKLRPEKTPFSSRYYVALIHLGEKSGYKLISTNPESAKELTIAANEIFAWSWPMDEETAKQENNVLIVAMQRTPIAADAINQAFERRFSPSKPLNVLQARDFLLPQFSGSYAFSYKSVFSESPCLKPYF